MYLGQNGTAPTSPSPEVLCPFMADGLPRFEDNTNRLLFGDKFLQRNNTVIHSRGQGNGISDKSEATRFDYQLAERKTELPKNYSASG